jgi:hypothetical protein
VIEAAKTLNRLPFVADPVVTLWLGIIDAYAEVIGPATPVVDPPGDASPADDFGRIKR